MSEPMKFLNGVAPAVAVGPEAKRSATSRTDAHGVAVIVPCYNDGATVAAAVGSAVVDAPSEIIIVDDGSDDPATLEVLDELADQGRRVVRQPNAGLPAARMAAVNATSCPYIAPLDADDLLEAGALIDLASALDHDSGLALAFGDYVAFGDVEGTTRTRGWDPWTICYVNRVPGGGSLIRREALLRAGGWSLNRGYEDWDLWMSLLEKGERAKHLPRTTFRYRIRGDRMLAATRDFHPELYGQLRSRHLKLFAARRRNWFRSSESLSTRLVLPIVSHLPGVSMTTRHQLALFLYEPAGWRPKLRRVAGRLRTMPAGINSSTSGSESFVR